MICTVDKMVFGGSCLTKIDGKTVFVQGALPGETVEIDIIQDKKDYSKARAIKIIELSVHRVEPVCPVYSECGGCDLQHASYEYQLELKKDIIHDCMNRNGVQALPNIQAVVSKNTEYRNRFQFSYGGLKSKSTNNVVVLRDCPCAVKEIRNFLQSPESGVLKEHERLQVFANEHTITFGHDGQSECNLSLLGKAIHFDVRGFFQSNITMLEKTIPLVVNDLKGKNLLDMYCGVGTLSLFAQDSFEHITLVEHNKKALDFAKKNFHSDNITVYAMTGEQWVKKAKKTDYNALIIDPPRSGIEKEMRKWICNQKIKTIRYLSCDVSTLARDTKELLNAGYYIDSFYFLDYYPNTSHIECLVHFSLLSKES